MKRLFSLVTAAILAVSLAAPASAAYYEAFEHPDVPFADMTLTGIDTGTVDAFCARFLSDPVGLYQALSALYDEIYTQSELAYIAMCRNAGSAALAAENERAEADYAYAADAIYAALGEALGGAQGGALRALMPEGGADGFIGYEPYSGEELEASSEETALIQQYYLLPDDRNYANAAAELYLQLAALRRAEAKRAGFDSYPEYAYIASFSREYLPEDARELQRIVKSEIAPLYVQCALALDAAGTAWDDEDIPSDAEILDAIGAHLGDISPELDEAFGFLRRNGLYCIGSGSDMLDMGYTTPLPAYRSAFLFNKVDTRFRAFKDTVHEFGHFNAAYHDPTPMLYQYSNMDVSELQAQGLELLFLPALQDILAGDDAGGRAVVALAVVEDMLGSVVDGCLYDEFEQAVYADPDMTVRELHALEQRLYKEYGLDALYSSDPYWVYISHLFDSPCYYISYAASALPALDLWLWSLDDRAAAIDAYMGVSAARTDAWFLDVLYSGGLCDVTDRRDLSRLADALRPRLNALLAEAPAARPRTAVRIVAGALTVVCAAAVLAIRAKRSRIPAEREMDRSYADSNRNDREKTE